MSGPITEPVDRRSDGLWDGCHDDPISPGDAHAVAAGWANTTQLSNALDAAAFEIERLRETLRDEIAMAEQTEKTLRNLHANWRDIVDESDPDGGPLIENILYWLIEDVGQADARKALDG